MPVHVQACFPGSFASQMTVFNLANFISPGVLGDLQDFRRNFERPIAAGNCKNATPDQRACAKQQSTALDQIAKEFVLRRLQKDVLTQLLPHRTEALIFCKPSHEQSRLYRKKAQASHCMDSTEILTTLTELRKICFHPNLLESHQGHPGAPTDIQSSGNLTVLQDLLLAIHEQVPQDKVVVVSNFTSALDQIESLILKPNNLSFVRLDGTTGIESRQTIVDGFNQTSTERYFCFLLSAKAGGW